MEIIDMKKLDQEVITPERFLKLTEEEKHNIKSTKIVVNVNAFDDLSNPDFGGILIQWNNPKYVAKF